VNDRKVYSYNDVADARGKKKLVCDGETHTGTRTANCRDSVSVAVVVVVFWGSLETNREKKRW
jgi:hypothetical protein